MVTKEGGKEKEEVGNFKRNRTNEGDQSTKYAFIASNFSKNDCKTHQ